MLILFAVLTALAVFVVAAVAVGQVTADLAVQPPVTVYDLDDAVDFVAEHLPEEITARLSYEDVRFLLGARLDYLERKGVASERSPEVPGKGAVVVPDDEQLAYVLGRVVDSEREISDDEVLAVFEAEDTYYAQIGAYGGPVAGPAEP